MLAAGAFLAGSFLTSCSSDDDDDDDVKTTIEVTVKDSGSTTVEKNGTLTLESSVEGVEWKSSSTTTTVAKDDSDTTGKTAIVTAGDTDETVTITATKDGDYEAGTITLTVGAGSSEEPETPDTPASGSAQTVNFLFESNSDIKSGSSGAPVLTGTSSGDSLATVGSLNVLLVNEGSTMAPDKYSCKASGGEFGDVVTEEFSDSTGNNTYSSTQDFTVDGTTYRTLGYAKIDVTAGSKDIALSTLSGYFGSGKTVQDVFVSIGDDGSPVRLQSTDSGIKAQKVENAALDLKVSAGATSTLTITLAKHEEIQNVKKVSVVLAELSLAITEYNGFNSSTETVSASDLNLTVVSASSSDEKVATAQVNSDGNVEITSVAAGSATITAKDSADHSATIAVTVAELGTITKTVTPYFASETNSDTASDSATLGFVGTAAASSAVTVATVEIKDGKIAVTSVAAGSAVVTVTNADSANDADIKATIPVTVSNIGKITLGTVTKYERAAPALTTDYTVEYLVLTAVNAIEYSSDGTTYTALAAGSAYAATEAGSVTVRFPATETYAASKTASVELKAAPAADTYKVVYGTETLETLEEGLSADELASYKTEYGLEETTDYTTDGYTVTLTESGYKKASAVTATTASWDFTSTTIGTWTLTYGTNGKVSGVDSYVFSDDTDSTDKIGSSATTLTKDHSFTSGDAVLTVCHTSTGKGQISTVYSSAAETKNASATAAYESDGTKIKSTGDVQYKTHKSYAFLMKRDGIKISNVVGKVKITVTAGMTKASNYVDRKIQILAGDSVADDKSNYAEGDIQEKDSVDTTLTCDFGKTAGNVYVSTTNDCYINKIAIEPAE